MKARWVIHPTPDNVESIAGEFKIHPVIASILLRRGLKNSSEISFFLNPSRNFLQDPFEFEHMDKAVSRIRLAIERKEKIVVYGDYDVDGITGSAILCPALQKAGALAEVYIPDRMREGYGLNLEALKNLLKKKIGLLITVDNGITGVEAIQFMLDQGVDTIVVDHHLPKDVLPPAFAFISTVVGQGKGDPNLAACGLAFKLAWAILGDYKEVEESLDLVVVGTIADIAPVIGENRILLKEGLPLLAKTKRQGLRALMDIAQVSRGNPSYRDIAFGLGPRINAAGRLGSPMNAYKLLTTNNPIEAQNLAQLLDEGNRDRQRVELRAFEEALKRVEEDFMMDTDKIIVLENAGWHEGVLGIVATRLVERYHRPAIVIALKGSIGKGSGRSLPEFSIFDCISECADLLETFGGHSQACGLSIKPGNIVIFRKRMNEVAAKSMAALELSPQLEIDGEVPLSAVDRSFLTDLDRLSPFGPGNKKPLFVSRRVKLKTDAKKRGKDTLHFWVSDEDAKTTCEVVGFRSYERWASVKQPSPLDIVYQPSLKEFNGIRSIELQLEDWSQSAERVLTRQP